MKKGVLLSISLIAILPMLCAQDVPTKGLTNLKTVPIELKPVVEFLDFIKQNENGESLYTTTKPVPSKWSAAQFMNFISATGVTFTDVNEDGSNGWQALKGHYTPQKIKTEIENSAGRIHQNFWTLATNCASPYLRLNIEENGDRYLVTVGDTISKEDMFKLTFVFEKGKYRLIQSDFLAVYEGDL